MGGIKDEHEVAETNAHLIAAAPELYEMLEEAVTALGGAANMLAASENEDHKRAADAINSYRRNGVATLAKASGQAALGKAA